MRRPNKVDDIDVPITLSSHVAFRVCNGGYLVHALVKDGEDMVFTNSVFVDVDVALAYARRVLLEWEGAYWDASKLGPLKIQDPNQP